MTMISGPGAPPGRELAGKVALVTGASRNIGRAIALALAAGGAAVAVNARVAKEEAERVAHEIRAADGEAEPFLADIADPAAVAAMVEGVLARFRRLDILVLNAAVRKETPFIDMTFEEWKRLLAISLDGAFHCVKACLPALIAAGGGSIVALGGLHALAGAKRRVHGSVAKSGLVGMTRALALELAEYGIRVNCVSPGHIETIRPAHRAERGDPKDLIPLGRRGEPREIADAVRFLSGPGASFITGQTLHVNGGQMMF
jgi:3-oxoacyl-[acyl-carrier protein] reductase